MVAIVVGLFVTLLLHGNARLLCAALPDNNDVRVVHCGGFSKVIGPVVFSKHNSYWSVLEIFSTAVESTFNGVTNTIQWTTKDIWRNIYSVRL